MTNTLVAVPARDLVMDSGVCHQAVFLDPSGNSLEIHRYAKD
jgi:hypothetical protein